MAMQIITATSSNYYATQQQVASVIHAAKVIKVERMDDSRGTWIYCDDDTQITIPNSTRIASDKLSSSDCWLYYSADVRRWVETLRT